MQYPNTQYYIQHGSEVLKKSLKMQLRGHSSTLSRKQRAHLFESRKITKGLPEQRSVQVKTN